MMKLATGALIGKLITLAALPVITRLYGPDAFGVMGIFVAATTIIIPVVTLQFNHALPIPRRDGLAANIAVLALLCIFTMTALLSAALGLFGAQILALLDAEPLISLAWAIPLAAMLVGISSVATMWQTRHRRYGSLTVGSAFESAIGNGLKIALGLVSPGPHGLIIGQSLQMSGRFILFLPAVTRDILAKRHRIDPGRLLQAAKSFARFPLYRTPAQFIGAMGMKAPILFIAFTFGAETAGQFALAMMAVTMPITLIGSKIGKAFYAETAHIGRKNTDDILIAMHQMVRTLLLCGIVMAACVAVAAPSLFPLIFGEDWSKAGAFTAALSMMLAGRLAFSPLMMVLSTFREELTYLIIDIQRTALTAAVFIAAWLAPLSAVEAVAAYSIAMFLHMAVSGWLIFRVVRRSCVDQPHETSAISSGETR